MTKQENESQKLEKQIREYCENIARNHLEQLELMEKNYVYYSDLVRKQLDNNDPLNNHRSYRIELIRRLSLMGEALEAADKYYTAINKARCN